MRLILKITVLFLLITIFFSLPLGSIHAQGVEQLDLPKTTLNPGSFYYPLKRLWEKAEGKFMFSSEAKKSFYESLLKTRLAELKYVVESKLLSEVQTSSERFAYYAGVLTEELVKQNKVNEKGSLIKEFEKYSKYLDKLRDNYPANSSYWMLVQHDINTLSILAERLR